MRAKRNTETVRLAFAERLRQAIEEMGYQVREQTALGELFGVTGQAVKKWLEGTSMPSRDNMAGVASVLAVQRAWLEYGEGDMRPRYAVSERRDVGYGNATIELKGSEMSILLAIRQLSNEDRSVIEHIIARMSGDRSG